MSGQTYRPTAQTVVKWLRDNGQPLGGLTGCDAQALRAAVQIVELYAYTRGDDLAQAFGTVVRQMQPEMRFLAYHSIAHVLDWRDRARVWAQAGLEPLGSIPECTYGPRQMPAVEGRAA